MIQIKDNNKSVAGYHMLMILTAVDNNFCVDEDLVIRDYISEEFPFRVDLDEQMDVIASLDPEHWKPHFEIQARFFYKDSTAEEREKFLQIAKKLIRADHEIAKSENEFYKTLLRTWNLDL